MGRRRVRPRPQCLRRAVLEDTRASVRTCAATSSTARGARGHCGVSPARQGGTSPSGTSMGSCLLALPPLAGCSQDQIVSPLPLKGLLGQQMALGGEGACFPLAHLQASSSSTCLVRSSLAWLPHRSPIGFNEPLPPGVSMTQRRTRCVSRGSVVSNMGTVERLFGARRRPIPRGFSTSDVSLRSVQQSLLNAPQGCVVSGVIV